jgi:BirA family transcriptional regulator, biotin operon repressor / biotin---[acetyl-CoA-carboxylase] ligase
MSRSPLLDCARVIAALPPGWAVDYHDSVSSTMDVARAATLAGAGEGLIVLAEEQTAGRGRLGRAWRSAPGANLAFTLLLRPALPLVRLLAMLVPLAVAEGIEEATALRPALKWPNDVQLAGRKVCGVLIDCEMQGERPLFALAGIGLNVNDDPSAEVELRDIATSLAAVAGQALDREAVLIAVVQALHRRLTDARRGADVRGAWRARLATLGQQIALRAGEQFYEGVAEDVDAEGSLLLRRADGALLTLPAGEVTTRI